MKFFSYKAVKRARFLSIFNFYELIFIKHRIWGSERRGLRDEGDMAWQEKRCFRR